MRVEITKSGLKWIYTFYSNDKQICSRGFYSSRIDAIEASYDTVRRFLGLNVEITFVIETSNTLTYDATRRK